MAEGGGGCDFPEPENPYVAGGGYDCPICYDATDNDCDGLLDREDPECWSCFSSPIVVDTLGDGFNLTSAAAGVGFDITGTGRPLRVGWIQRDDAWLALDRNGNGTIDSGVELFGNSTPQPPSNQPNGFLALAEYDKPANGGNADGVIDGRDTVFASLRLWRDTNHDGVSDTGELHTPPALDVARIHLDYKESKLTDEHGNRFKWRAKVSDAKGAKVGRWAWDVFLTTGR